MITSTFAVEVMSTASSYDATVKGFPTPSLPKHAVKPDYAEIKEVHQLFMENVSFVESDLVRGQNGYLGLVLLT